ncbi:NIMA-interacting protein TinC [Purpureocillium lavendulum]|uniref:NIMA-interacting protein TinC n=1 Tax=Purpureocillium lavendulum TaxID=1247861 RepID=A0AB34FVI8_9HYPO|nr:NIMA-interacting protein TinC [Purpureocillium lavendulum]
MADAKDTKTLEARCSCGGVQLTFDVPLNLLPLPVYLCHCSLCRYATGSPCTFHTQLPEGLLPKFVGASSEKNLSSWHSKGAGCTYDFCSTCGCHVGGVSLDRKQWTPSTSIFTDHGPENFRINQHVFSKSAKGDGIASLVTHIGGRDLSVWNPAADHPTAKVVESEAEVGDDGEERLRAECQCGGVSFTIQRPTQAVLDDPVLSKFVSPRDKKKWLALYDICNDCRLVTGTHVVAWTFIPLSLCEPRIDSTLKIGTSKTYSTSEGVLRSFCGTCGATVFFSCDERRPTEAQAVVDIATGIIRAPEGVMAEEWFTWRTRPAYLASGVGYDKGFGEALDEGMKRWAVDKYGEELNVNVG